MSITRVVRSGIKFLINGREKSFVANRVKAKDLARTKFIAALMDKYPGQSPAFVAREWAATLDRNPRTIENWLAGTSSAPVEDVFIVCASLGVWRSMEILTDDRSRNDILQEMSRR